mgnify:CR=1 FL=1
MAKYTFNLPDIGEGIAEVEIVEWRVAVGDRVAEDQTLCDVMTDKSAVEVPLPVAGRVAELGGAVGQVLAVGAMLSRSWSLADYPFGTDIGLSDAWGSSGSGYGLLTRAIRYTSRPFEVAEGDLVVEGTYDIGKRGWERNKPRFLEVWMHYGRGVLSLLGFEPDLDYVTLVKEGRGRRLFRRSDRVGRRSSGKPNLVLRAARSDHSQEHRRRWVRQSPAGNGDDRGRVDHRVHH